jgi:hypothetical protein
MVSSVNTRYGWQPVKKILSDRRISTASVARQAGLTYNQVAAGLYGATLPRPQLQRWLERTLGLELRDMWTKDVVSALVDEMFHPPTRWLTLVDRHGKTWEFDMRSYQVDRWEADGEEPLDLRTLIETRGPIGAGGAVRESNRHGELREDA